MKARGKKVMRLRQWQNEADAEHVINQVLHRTPPRATVQYKGLTTAKRKLLVREMEQAHVELKRKLEAHVLAYSLAQEARATEPDTIKWLPKMRRAHLCALSQIKMSFMDDLYKLRSVTQTLHELNGWHESKANIYPAPF